MAAGGSAPEFFTSIVGATIVTCSHHFARVCGVISQCRTRHQAPNDLNDTSALESDCGRVSQKGTERRWLWHDRGFCSLQRLIRHRAAARHEISL